MSLSPEAIARFKALMAEPSITPSNATKTKREQKDEFEKRFGAITPTADIVAKLEATARIIWVPSGYILFVRQATCRNCESTEKCLDTPQLFLQQKRGDRRDDSNPYLYTAVKSIEHHQLPRRKILKVTTTPFCLSCFETKSCGNSLNSPQVDTVLHIDDLEKLPPALLLERLREAASPFSSGPLSPAIMRQAEYVGSPSEKVFGFECEEREFAKPVTVEG